MPDFSSFCNYLRGVKDLPISNSNQKTSILEKIKLFFKFLSDLIKLAKLLFPKFVNVSTFLFLLLLANLIGVEFVVYQVGLLSGKFLTVLTKKDAPGFTSLAFLPSTIIPGIGLI